MIHYNLLVKQFISCWLLLIIVLAVFPLAVAAQDTAQSEKETLFCEAVALTGFVSGGFLSTTPRVVTVGDEVLLTGILRNQTDYVVPSTQTFIVLYEEASSQALPVAVQQVGQTLNFVARQEQQVPLTWTVPTFIASGEYRAYLYLSQAKESADVWSEINAVGHTLRDESSGLAITVTNPLLAGGLSDYIETIAVSGSDQATLTEMVDVLYLENGEAEVVVQLRNATVDQVLRGQIAITTHADFAPAQANQLRDQSRELRVLPGQSFDLSLEAELSQQGSIAVWYVYENDERVLLHWVPTTSRLEMQQEQYGVDALSDMYPFLRGVVVDRESVFGCVHFPFDPTRPIATGVHQLMLQSREQEVVQAEAETILFSDAELSPSGMYGISLVDTSTQRNDSEIVLSIRPSSDDLSEQLVTSGFTRQLVVDVRCRDFPGLCATDEASADTSRSTEVLAAIGIVAAGLLVVLLILLIWRRNVISGKF